MADLRRISRELALKRVPAMYGLELSGLTPSEIFNEEDAKNSLKLSRLVYDVSKRFIEEYIGEHNQM